MRKKIIIISLVVSVVGILAFLGYSIVAKTNQKKVIAKQLQVIPEFELLTLHGELFTNKNLQPNVYTVFIYFNSECDFCQHEAKDISNTIEKFKNTQFIFVSIEPIEVIQNFAEQYNLNNQSNITFLHDNLDIFHNRFGARSIPYILIYNKNQELIKKHKGQLNAKGILNTINQ